MTIRALMKWREISKIIACASKGISDEVYVVGGVAEGRATVFSDIDIAIVFEKRPDFHEASRIRAEIIERALKLGLPIYAPVELHSRKGRVEEI